MEHNFLEKLNRDGNFGLKHQGTPKKIFTAADVVYEDTENTLISSAADMCLYVIYIALKIQV